MTSLNSPVILVTGATDGIGLETARLLAAAGATVIIHGRTAARATEAIDDIRRTTGTADLIPAVADFASLAEVRTMASELTASLNRLDVLINNAGIYPKRRELTTDGFERTFAINQLAPFLLTNMLLPLLRKSAPSRIVTVASTVHKSVGMDFDNLQGERRFSAYDAYALSKLGNVLFTYELARRLRGAGITANCMHPGVVNTKLLRAAFSPGGTTAVESARSLAYLAMSPDIAGTTGKYFVTTNPSTSSPITYDEGLQRRFWEVCEKMTGLQGDGAKLPAP